MDKGIVFNIQRFCLHDGPGIRTLVFLKGCPLRCKWCSNPESQSALREVMHFKNLCIKCGKCVSLCPQKAITFLKKFPVIDRTRCKACGICVQGCSSQALRISGEFFMTDHLFELILRDKTYFDLSGGGVTFSGGEPLMQPAFLKSILRKLRLHGVQTAVETSGYCSKDLLADIAQYTDIFLFDIKHICDAAHKKGTNAGNAKIIDNLRLLSKMHDSIVVRIPVIPKFNMDKPTLDGMVQLISECDIRNVQLLAYHNYGLSKYRGIGRKYALERLEGPNEHDLEELKAYLTKKHGKVHIGIMHV